MNYIDYSNTYFTTKNMMPEPGESLSLLWGRKIVNNIANTYGIIGTLNFNGVAGYRSFNLQLSLRYMFPPSVYIYYTDASGNMHMPIDTHPTFGEFEPMDGIYYEAGDWRGGKVYGLIQNDNLIVFCPKNGVAYNVYYRIVGV